MALLLSARPVTFAFMRHFLQVHGALLLVNMIFGANYSIAKEVMPAHVEPFGFIVLRAVGAGILFFGLHSIFIREKVERKDMFRMFLCGLFGVAGNQLLFFWGLSITTPINASLIMITTPILVLIISNFLLNEKITIIKGLGILTGAAGAATIILFGKELTFGSHTALGDLLVFINACSFGTYLVLAKPLMVKYNPFTVIRWVFFFGMILTIPFGFQDVLAVEWGSIPTLIWLCIGYVILLNTFVNYLLNFVALRRVNPSVVSIYMYLQPVFASVVALLWGKDQITVEKVIATVLIFTGVYLVTNPLERRRIRKERKREKERQDGMAQIEERGE